MLKVVKYGGFVLLSFVMLELLAFLYYLNHENVSVRTDAVIVFRGDKGRVMEGYEVAANSQPAYMVISPANQKRIDSYNGRFKKTDQVKVLLEEKARTTFENVLLTLQIIEQNNIKSIVLVTSDYHVPRSIMLYKILTWRTPLDIYFHGVSSAADKSYGNIERAKLFYNEMVEFVGSMIEYLQYLILDDLPLSPLHDNPAVQFFKGLILFDVKKA